MNGAINQRFCVAFFLESDGGHCDSEFVSKQQGAIDFAKRWLRRNFEKHKEILYAEVSNMLNPKAGPIRVNLFDVGDRIYVWDQYKNWQSSKDRPRGGDWQGGRAAGTIKEISGTVAKILYDDMEELIEERLTDIKHLDPVS